MARKISILIVLLFICEIRYDAFSHVINQHPQLNVNSAQGSAVFQAFWNVPSALCRTHFGIQLPLDRFNIIANEGQNCSGDAVVIFYNHMLGLYPHYNRTTGEVENGGLPQLGNLSAHLEKASSDIQQIIPNKDFNGIGIIDWELWRPQWAQNFAGRRRYQENSVQLVRQRHPELDTATIKILAKIEFEEAAQGYFQSTLRLAKDMRPNAKWGYYHFPYCENKQKKSGQCNRDVVITNNDITWLFEESTVLYPSIYLQGYEKYKKQFVQGKLNEALRVRKLIGQPNLPILAYTRFNYSHSKYYYTKLDLTNTVLQAAEMGLNGVIFWGDDNDTESRQSCTELESYINSTLGPFFTSVQDAAETCSANLCNGHGRCIGDIRLCAKIFKKHVMSYFSQVTDCTCSCFGRWSGDRCEIENATRNRKNISFID